MSLKSLYDNRKKEFSLLFDRLSNKYFKIYTYNQKPYLYFFITKTIDNIEQYAGSLLGIKSGNEYNIKESYSEKEYISQDFYLVMFSAIFASNLNISTIYSDDSLSQSAINAYKKISDNHKLKVSIIDNETEKEYSFSNDLLLSHPKYLVKITETEKEHMKYIFDSYYKRLEEDFFIERYNNKETVVNNYCLLINRDIE